MTLSTLCCGSVASTDTPCQSIHAAYDFDNRGEGKKQLGTGHHGVVVQAYSHKHGCSVAIKMQKKSHQKNALASGEEYLLSSVGLPHLVQMLDAFEGPTRCYTVMQLGEPLGTRGPGWCQRAAHKLSCLTLPPRPSPVSSEAEVVDLMVEVIKGMEEMHDKRIYHRDMKLGNVIKLGDDPAGQYRLIDLGKSASQPSRTMEPLYAWADARAVCRMITLLLKPIDRQKAADFKKWYRSVPSLRLKDVKAHPLFAERFTNSPAPARGGSRVSRCLYPAYRLLEKATAKVPQWTRVGPPPLPPGILPNEALHAVSAKMAASSNNPPAS